MQVLYVDVYFFINFTVDAAAVTLAAKLLHIKSSLWRISALSAIGALLAVLDAVMVFGNAMRLFAGVLFLISVGILIAQGVPRSRRIKVAFVFLCFEMLLGGIVNYAYVLLDRYMEEVGEYLVAGTANKKALVFSVLILLAIGVLKLFIMLFSEQTGI